MRRRRRHQNFHIFPQFHVFRPAPRRVFCDAYVKCSTTVNDLPDPASDAVVDSIAVGMIIGYKDATTKRRTARLGWSRRWLVRIRNHKLRRRAATTPPWWATAASD